jgi:tRNA (guanosine-2'-O-)-methyltransferase
MLAACDDRCVIPIGGFVQSFNISVAAAVSLYHVREDRIRRLGAHGDLSPNDRTRLRADFYIRALRNAQSILDLSSGRDAPPEAR